LAKKAELIEFGIFPQSKPWRKHKSNSSVRGLRT
jgi:hypothetical protein